jgi:hypothetical protein
LPGCREGCRVKLPDLSRGAGAIQKFYRGDLAGPAPGTPKLNKFLFSATFDYLYLTLLPESTVASHHQNLASVSTRCSELATPGIEYVDTATEIRRADAERTVFDRWTERLSDSMYKIQLMITYSKDAFPKTLKGQLDED